MGYSETCRCRSALSSSHNAERVADEANTAAPVDLLERTAHPDPMTSRLLLSAVDVLEGNEALDALFRQQLTDAWPRAC